jgi:hypothetical protein
VLSSAASLWKSFRTQAERDSGIVLKLFGFIAESVFTFIPESCSGSPRNAVRNHPGIAFTFARIPQEVGDGTAKSSCAVVSIAPEHAIVYARNPTLWREWPQPSVKPRPRGRGGLRFREAVS